MIEDIYSRIKSNYPSLTQGEKRIADFINIHQNDCLNLMSISELANSCGVSNTLVSRFCKSLGLSGYQDLRVRLAVSSSESIESILDDDLLPANISLGDDDDIVIKKLYQEHIKAIHESYSLLNIDELHKAVYYIKNSDQIRFFGVGTSHLSAMEGMYKFLHILPNVYCLSDIYMQTMGASTLNEDDVAIIISYSGESKEVIELAKAIRNTRAKSICITSYAKSTLAQNCDVVLLCGGYETPVQNGSYTSQSAMLFVLDVLYSEVYRTMFEYSKEINRTVVGSIIGR